MTKETFIKREAPKSSRAARRRLAKAAAGGTYQHARTGKIVKALDKAGVRVLVRHGVKGNIEEIITNVVRRHVPKSALEQKVPRAKDGSKGKVAQLVGRGIPDRGCSTSDLPWATEAEIEAAVDLANTYSSDEIAEKLGATRETINAWRKEGRLLGVEGAKRGVRYPKGQIGPNFAPLPVDVIITSLDGDHWAAWRFLAGSVPELGGATGFALLRAHKAEQLRRVLEARAYGAFT